MFLLCLIQFASIISNLYNPADDVIQLNSKNFDDIVIQSKSPVLVEFYAKWCGHCKNLAPEWKKAATALKEIVKLVAVDGDESSNLMKQYGIKGFPTIKLFLSNNKQVEFSGERTASGIVDEVMRLLAQHARSQLNGNQRSDNKEKDKSYGKVVELSDSTFDALIMGGSEPSFVEFYAPWCGHCKNLEPLWKQVAERLAGKVKVAAVDATVNKELATRFSINGFPSLKFFPLGVASSEAISYEGGRSVDDMVRWAEQQLENNKPSVKVTELTSQDVWDDMCGSRSLCVVTFLPHLLDCDSTCRGNYQRLLQKISDSSRAITYGWLWLEGAIQWSLEYAVDVGGFGYPAMVIVSRTRQRYGVLKGRFDENGINDFLGQVMAGKVSTSTLQKFTIETTTPWDGQDAVPIDEEDFSDIDEL